LNKIVDNTLQKVPPLYGTQISLLFSREAATAIFPQPPVSIKMSHALTFLFYINNFTVQFTLYSPCVS